jgi:hypothetical protein
MDIASQSSSFHQLENTWVLWSHFPQEDNWSLDSYKKICDFVDVEGTAAITEIIPENMIKNCMLFIMREGILPIWEDSKNRNGGCFSYKISNKQVVTVWKDLTYVLVGETISKDKSFVDDISGITISPKKNFCIVKIWMNNCNHQNAMVVTNEIQHLLPAGCIFKKHVPIY